MFQPLVLSRREQSDGKIRHKVRDVTKNEEQRVYPHLASALAALERRFGRAKGVLGGGMFGQAFDMGDGVVAKITESKPEAEAVKRVIQLRRAGNALPGFVRYFGEPISLGRPYWAIRTERVDPIALGFREPLLVVRDQSSLWAQLRAILLPRITDFGTVFEFASETAQDWRNTSVESDKARLLDEYRHYVREIRRVQGFEKVGASMARFLEATSIPLFDIRPENCGRVRRGSKHIVCFDIMLPEVGPESPPRPMWRP